MGEEWASKKPKLWGEVKPGLNTLLVPKAGSSLLAHCVHMRVTGKEFKNKVDHLVHVRLMELSKEGRCRWFVNASSLPRTTKPDFMVWRSPAKRIESAVRMFMDDTTDKAFKEKWWAMWLSEFRPFSIEGMRRAVSGGIDGTFTERHFMPYVRLLMHAQRYPKTLVPLELLETFLTGHKVAMPQVKVRNESSEYAKSINLSGMQDLMNDVERIDMSVWRKYCGGHGFDIYGEDYKV